MISSAVQEQAVLELLRDSYAQKGLTFVVHPTPDMVPEFLGTYRPDAIATDGKGGTVIEVKIAPTGSKSEQKLSEVAARFIGHPNWTFRIVRLDDLPQSGVGLGSLEAARGALLEAEEALRNGLNRAALLIAWATLENVARLRLAGVVADVSRPLQPLSIVSALEQYGYITEEEASRLRVAARARNLTAHGQFDEQSSEGAAIHAVLQAVRGLIAQIQAPALPQ